MTRPSLSRNLADLERTDPDVRSGDCVAVCPVCHETLHRTTLPSDSTTVLSPHRQLGASAWSNDRCPGTGQRVDWVPLDLPAELVARIRAAGRV